MAVAWTRSRSSVDGFGTGIGEVGERVRVEVVVLKIKERWVWGRRVMFGVIVGSCVLCGLMGIGWK